MTELREEEDPVLENGQCPILAGLFALSAVVTGSFIDNWYWYGNIGGRDWCREEEVEIGLFNITVNEGDRFGQGKRERGICGHHTLAGPTFTAGNCEFHGSFPHELFSKSPARECILCLAPL
jgi:hypothetical protein